MQRRFVTLSVRSLVVAGALALVAATQAACAPTSTLVVSTPEDVLGLTTRIVFSTHDNAVTAPRSVTLTNTGSEPIDVTGLTFAGQNPTQFALAGGQPTSFTIEPDGGTATVSAVFAPTSTGNKFATLTIENSSSTPQVQIALRGVSARGTLGNTEPKLSQIMQLFGYSTDVGFSSNNTATTRVPLGDEVVAPYFVRVDSSQPVSLIPIARYTGVNTSVTDNGRTPENSSAKTSLFKFPGDEFADDTPGDGIDESIYTENQKVWPQILSGTTTFNPTAAFGIYEAGTNYSDDRWNVDENGLTYRNIRVYPAKGPGGVAIPNTWILGLDVKPGSPEKNYDYQDQVLLLKNAKPTLDPGPAPGAATTLSFDAPVTGTVVDKDGEGTGFTSIQPNKNGTQAHPELVDLTGGTLRITSTAGKSSGTENLQDNALQLTFDGSRTDSFVQARLQGPMTDLTSGSQQKAIFFGPDQDNYLKVEVEHRTSPSNGVFLTAFREQAGNTATIGQIKLADPSLVATLDLGIRADLETGALQARYRINSNGAWTDLGTPFSPSAVLRFFSPQAKAGVLVSHTGSTTPIVGVYDSFSVTTGTK
jgi:hypothetical protein